MIFACVLLRPFRTADLQAHDSFTSLQRAAGPDRYDGPGVAIVGFDEGFLAAMPEPFALVHVHLGKALSAIATAAPKVVALDLTLPSKRFDFLTYRDRPEIDIDAELARGLITLREKAPVVLGVAWEPEHRRYSDLLVDYVAAARWRTAINPDSPQGRDARASVTVCRDPDGRVRAFPGADCQSVPAMPPLAERMVDALGTGRARAEGLVNFAVGEPLNYIPVGSVLRAMEANDRAFLDRAFSGKAVLIGAILENADRLDLPTPIAAWAADARTVAGVVFHAQAFRSLASGRMIRPLGDGLLLAIGGMLGLLWLVPGLRLKLVLSLALPVATAGGFWILLRQDIYAPPVTFLACALLPLAMRSAQDVYRLALERRRLRVMLDGTASPKVVDRILSGQIEPNRKGRLLHVHAMFADLRGFTPLSERAEPERVIRILNAYLGEATGAVHAQGGTVIDFAGDGILAVFGAPEPLDDNWQAAFTAAKDIQARVARLNEMHADCRVTPIEVGIGIHSGDVVFGFVGSRDRYQVAVTGDAVNVASRIQGLSAELGFPVIATVEALPGGMLPVGVDAEPLGPQKIKGHTDVDLVGFRA